MVTCTEMKDKESGEVVAKLYTSLFIKGIGGFGQRGKVITKIPKVPKRKPDAISEMTTTKN